MGGRETEKEKGCEKGDRRGEGGKEGFEGYLFVCCFVEGGGDGIGG